MSFRKTVSLAAAALGLSALIGAAPASAAVVTSIPGGTTYTFPEINFVGAGSETVAPGITWSAAGPYSDFGYNGGYGLNGNGNWDSAFSAIATNNSDGSMTIAFDTPVGAVGSFLNYATDSGIASIAVYDATHTLIESLNLSISTPGAVDGGAFYGFSEATSDISYIVYSGAYIIASNLVVGSPAAAVPEPITLSLFGAGVAGAAFLRRRKKS
jgi:hypothetical protein